MIEDIDPKIVREALKWLISKPQKQNGESVSEK